jgi:hypothetical protein
MLQKTSTSGGEWLLIGRAHAANQLQAHSAARAPMVKERSVVGAGQWTLKIAKSFCSRLPSRSRQVICRANELLRASAVQKRESLIPPTTPDKWRKQQAILQHMRWW